MVIYVMNIHVDYSVITLRNALYIQNNRLAAGNNLKEVEALIHLQEAAQNIVVCQAGSNV